MLSLKVEPRTYNLGETIIRRGEIGRELFFVTSGMVEILSDDNLRVLARFRDGQFFGEIAVLLDVPRIANVKAVSQVEVFVLTKENLEAVFEAVPGAAQTITAEGNRLYNNWLIHNGRADVNQDMQDDSAGPMDLDGRMNHQSLNVPRDTTQSPFQNIQLQDNFASGQPALATDLSTPPTRRSSQDHVDPFEAGHPSGNNIYSWTFVASQIILSDVVY